MQCLILLTMFCVMLTTAIPTRASDLVEQIQNKNIYFTEASLASFGSARKGNWRKHIFTTPLRGDDADYEEMCLNKNLILPWQEPSTKKRTRVFTEYESDQILINKQYIPVEYSRGTDWQGVFIQSSFFLAIQTSFRLTEEKTRTELRGPFFQDWFRSIKSLHGWDDKNKTFTNWVAHPMSGSVTAFIFAQNNRQSQRAELGWNRDYRVAKTKQFLFALVFSEFFEIGPISESSIGNVGLYRGRHAYIDHVVTPVLGIAWSVGEDIIDAYVIRSIRLRHPRLGRVLGSFLNPARSFANLLAFKPPWRRSPHCSFSN